MTRAQARLLIRVLTAQKIPFTFRRENSSYIVAFGDGYANIVARSIGA